MAPTQEPDPAKRALLVLKWLMNTLKQQYCSRSEKLGSEKKPLNPFLGELFLGHWDDETGTTHLISEQVSHHPPVTAYCIWNDRHRIRLEGYNGQKASFSRTIQIKQIGHALLTLTPPNSSTPEAYLITLPALHIENLIYGAPFVELSRSTHIVSSSGYIAKIDYSGRGWLSGKKNTFAATLWKDGEGSERNPLYAGGGQWSDTFVFRECEGGDPKRGHEILSFSPSDIQLSRLQVAPLEQQDVFESRRAWSNVARNLEKGDLEATSHYKSRIENAQRALRRKEREDGREWRRVFFSTVGADDPAEATFHHLVKMITAAHVGVGVGVGPGAWEGVAPDKTAGVWRFDHAKAGKAHKPYHDEGPAALGEKDDGTSAPVSRVSTFNGEPPTPL